MFNNYLKGRVDAPVLGLVEPHREPARPGSQRQLPVAEPGRQRLRRPSSKHSGGYGSSQPAERQRAESGGGEACFVPPGARHLRRLVGRGPGRWPNSNRRAETAYATPTSRRPGAWRSRWAGTVTIYDTLDHQIGGFSQQQSSGGSLSFSSQYGLIDVASLPVISVNGQPSYAPARPRATAVRAAPGAPDDIHPAGRLRHDRKSSPDLRAKGHPQRRGVRGERRRSC